jgi:ABC-type antimicrobial peptide transport system permease subunit
MALGATREDVLRLILRQGSRLAITWIAIGMVTATAATRLLSSILFSVTPNDPPTFIEVALLLGAVALGACLVPAIRAAKVDPMVALRYE